MKSTISIIVTHWAQNEFRSETLRKCINSLIETTRNTPCEIIVVDNGDNIDDSRWLLDQTAAGHIHHYVRNNKNYYFGYARNQAIKLSQGDYIHISDNDIEYKSGWVQWCVSILDAFPDKKYLVTPLRTDRQHRNERYWRGVQEFKGENYLLNLKAGSNSWMMKRESFEEIGPFINHRIAGSKWVEAAYNKGYLVVTKELNSLAVDTAFGQGYNFKETPDLSKTLTNGEVCNP